MAQTNFRAADMPGKSGTAKANKTPEPTPEASSEHQEAKAPAKAPVKKSTPKVVAPKKDAAVQENATETVGSGTPEAEVKE